MTLAISQPFKVAGTGFLKYLRSQEQVVNRSARFLRLSGRGKFGDPTPARSGCAARSRALRILNAFL